MENLAMDTENMEMNNSSDFQEEGGILRNQSSERPKDLSIDSNTAKPRRLAVSETPSPLQDSELDKEYCIDSKQVGLEIRQSGTGISLISGQNIPIENGSSNPSTLSWVMQQSPSYAVQISPESSSYDIPISPPLTETPEPNSVLSPPIKHAKRPGDFQEVPLSTEPILDAINNNSSPKITYHKKISPAPQLSRTKSQIDKRMKSFRIPRDSSFKHLARQISSKRDVALDLDNDVVDGIHEGPRPKSYFDLAVMTMCCCVSPLGFAAVIMAVLSGANYKSKHMEKARKYGKIALILSICGILSSVGIAVALLVTLGYPWNDLQKLPPAN